MDSPLSTTGSQSWVTIGDYELNFAGVSGAPTLRPSSDLERRLSLPSTSNPKQAGSSPLHLGVHIHAFHLEECQQILDHISHALPGCDLLITTDTSSKKTAIEHQLSQYASPPWCQRLEVRTIANRGRNLVPLLSDGLSFLQSCELALHLHTKRTEHKSFGGNWFSDLLSQLVGESQRVDSVIQAFTNHPDLGLAMPHPGELIRPYLNWGANFDIAAVLVKGLWPGRQLSIQAPLIFPQGMMLWFRPQALAPLADALALLSPLPLEPVLHDGTPLHALERLTAHACEVAGLRWALLPINQPDSHDTSSHSMPAQLSVWDPQPEAYLAGVAALAEQHRRLQEELAERGADLQAIRNHRDSLDEALQAHGVTLQEQDHALAEASATLRDREADLQALRQSLSWRLTGPLRRLTRMARGETN
jgi:lipopolysaccharide biosynthesis protein